MCIADTKKGTKCKLKSSKDSEYCWRHHNIAVIVPAQICAATLKNGKLCHYKAKEGGKCGKHAAKRENSGTGEIRSKGHVKFENHTYMANVSGSSKDKGAWKTFWEKHSGGEKYPKTCRVKDCERTATCTGHMYMRSEWEAGERKNNYLVPICSHHNSIKYDAPNFVEAKKTTVAVKILENNLE